MRLLGSQRTEKHLLQAQQAVVEALRQGLTASLDSTTGPSVMDAVLASVWATEPETWARQAGIALRETIVRLEELVQRYAEQIQALRWQVERLEQTLATYQAEAPAERLRALSAEKDHWQKEAGRLAERVRTLEAAMESTRHLYEQKVAHLQREIMALNRIIVEQQEALHGQGQ